MKKRTSIITLLVTGVVLLPASLYGQQHKLKKSRPNILLINADDMDAGDLSCYGAKHISTPVLDGLAKNGIQVRTAYTATMSGPSRAMLLSGKFATQTGHWHNDALYNLGEPDPCTEETFYNLLHDAGYKTVVVGKWSWDVPKPSGFDESFIYPRTINRLPKGVVYDGYIKNDPQWRCGARFWHPMILDNGKYVQTTENDYGPDMFSDYLVDFMKRNKDSEQPLLMYYAMVLTHCEDARKMDGMGFPPTPDPEHPGQVIDRGYNGMKEYTDYIVGKLIKALEDNGLRENTIVIFTTDNGSYGKRGKGRAYEPGAWVPFIINCPGIIPAKGMVDELVTHADILPTFAELAGVPYTKDKDGISFLPIMEGKEGKREYAIGYIGREVVIKDKRWLMEKYNAPEGKTLFWDCGNKTIGNSYEDPNLYYKNVTNSNDPEVLKAKSRFNKMMKHIRIPQDGLLNKK